MAGISMIGGNGGILPPKRSDVPTVGAEASEAGHVTDAVNLHGTASDWKAVNRASLNAAGATHEVASEQPFTPEWSRTWLNGPGSPGGLRNINGDTLVGSGSQHLSDATSDGWNFAG